MGNILERYFDKEQDAVPTQKVKDILESSTGRRLGQAQTDRWANKLHAQRGVSAECIAVSRGVQALQFLHSSIPPAWFFPELIDDNFLLSV